MSDIYLHIGLHKTATKYFQHHVFPFLDEKKFLYNPEKLTQLFMDVLKADKNDRPEILSIFKKQLQVTTESNLDKKILISREIMSGDLFSAYKDWELNIQILYECFPQAKILMAFRYQPDWLASCYRESLHEHHYQSINRFLNYDIDADRFIRPESKINEEGFAHLYALNLDYSEMLDVLFKKYDEQDVLVWFFEDFKKSKTAVTNRVLSFIGSSNIEVKRTTTIPNRGYSGLSITLSLFRKKVLSKLGLNLLIHRPIFFYGENSIPAGNIELTELNREKYWGPQFKRDNEEVRSASYPKLSVLEQLKREFTWRHFIKHRFDRLLYKDWDLLGELRSPLNNEYRQINIKLEKYFSKKSIPDKYTS